MSDPVEALLVGEIWNGRIVALARAFPSHTLRTHTFNGRFEDTTFDLDTKNFEPYVYVERGLSAARRDELHERALRVREMALRPDAAHISPF